MLVKSIDLEYVVCFILQVEGLYNDLVEELDSNNNTLTRVEISKISGSGGAIAINVKDGRDSN